MEPQSNSNDDNGNNNSYSWNSVTNWTIASGSLDASIIFESLDAPFDSETVDSKRKLPLVLKPPSPDYGPCEIKIRFAQKHEVRQVYVRSTARVYEIYCAPSLQSSNEYLCTVRCGIAARDDEVLDPVDTEELADAQSKGCAGELGKEKCNDNGNIISNEDDWVEVKAPDSSLQDNQNNSMPKKIDANAGTSVQDFYEATAEITDADACGSLTLRLLSLQSKGCLYVDEIYVFADLVESDDLETQAPQMGNSAGNSLMAILAPTLLQLSKTGVNRRQEIHASDSTEKREYLEVGSKVTESTNIANEVNLEESTAAQSDVKLQEVNEATTELPQFQILAQVSDREQRHDSVAKTNVPYDQIERALEQLVTRVSRIEDICLRFEENMLKPINSIEARLQRVEQHVEMLTKNSHYSGLPSCTRISAPAFSCNGSNSSSFCNEGSDYPACRVSELEEKDIRFDKLPNRPDDMSVSVNDTRFLPSLVVTAPEFSCGDDEETNDALEPPKDCPQENSKQALSIDDALAAALAGFLSATSVQPLNYTQTVKVKAPDFTIEENGNDGEVASLDAQSHKPIVPPIFFHESNGTECISDSVSTSTSTPSILGQVMGNFDDGCFKETSEGVDGDELLHEGDISCSSLATSVNCPTTQAEHELAQTDDSQIAESTCRGLSSNGISDSRKTDILRQFLQSQTEDSSDALHEGADASGEDGVEGSEKDMLQNVFKSSSASCVLDFELPILDVKFASWETSNAKSPLEALFTDMPEFEVEAPCVQQRDDAVTGEHSNIILVEDGNTNCPVTGDHPLVDLDIYDARDAPSSVEGEALQDSYTCNEEEMFASLI